MQDCYKEILDYLKSREEFLSSRRDAYAAVYSLRYFGEVIVKEYGVQNGEPFVVSSSVNEDALKEVINLARDDIDAFEYLLSIGKEYASKSKRLENFIYKCATQEIERPTKRRGRDPRNTFSRDFTINIAVYRAIEMGLPAYAGGNNKKETACMLVENILRREFGINCNVTEIWKKRPIK
ncbi:MAG: hypothetical protein COB03_03390 [Alteromonas sp.]|nr:MAG: hypothetical protein COB03_03390 [Alteromonas sp.]